MRGSARLLPAAMALTVLFGWSAPARAQEGARPPPAAQEAPGAKTAPARPTGRDTAEDIPLDLRRADSENAPAAAETPGRYLWRALLSLAIVVALIYAVYFGARLWRGTRMGPRRGGTMIEVLDAARIDANKTVYVVALGPKTIVLGGSGAELTFICELNDAEAAGFRTEAARANGEALEPAECRQQQQPH